MQKWLVKQKLTLHSMAYIYQYWLLADFLLEPLLPPLSSLTPSASPPLLLTVDELTNKRRGDLSELQQCSTHRLQAIYRLGTHSFVYMFVCMRYLHECE